MAQGDTSLTPVSIPSTIDSATSPTLRSKASRNHGLLGKMFRKGPPKHPKLNPVGISSKDFFANEPVVPQTVEPYSAKLSRKLSALSPAQAASPQSLTPKSAVTSAFPASATARFPDTEDATLLQTPPAMAQERTTAPAASPGSGPRPRHGRPSRLTLNTSDASTHISRKSFSATASARPAVDDAADGGQPAGERKRRGSLWRAKLSFTNVRRPETRRQRHQSFDSNAIDIAAHPRLFPESPLVSLPAAAPASSQRRASDASSNQLLADTLLGPGMDITAPHTALPGSVIRYGLDGAPETASDDMAAVGNLGAIDKDFLLTIQRNSALEARRQRRRETRRSTMSALATAEAPKGALASAGHEMPLPPDGPLSDRTENPRPSPGEASCNKGHGGQEGSTVPQDQHAAAGDQPEVPEQPDAAAAETAVRTPSPDGPERTAAEAPAAGAPERPRPTSPGFPPCADAQVANSSASARSSGDEEACGRTTFNKVALSELREAAVKESITEAALASASSSPAGARPNTATPPKSVPPVPPLPRHISPKAHKRTEPEKLFPLDPTARPETAHARGSPRRLLSERRKYRGSTSAVPSPLYLGDSIPPNSLNKALLLDIGSARAPLTGGGWNPQELGLQNYRMGPMSAGPMGGVKSSSPLAVPELVDGYQPACIRKLSHPDAQLQSTPQKSTSPDILSKSAFNLGSRMSMDSNKAGTPRESGSTKHGFSRLFSPSPPSRRQQQPANSIDIQPTSPTVSSLVGDPAAQRRIRDQLASSRAFDRLLEEDDEFTMAISLTPTVAGERQQLNTPPRSK